MQTVFDLQQARTKRDEGIKRVAKSNERFLGMARIIAWRICKDHGTVTMDDVRKECQWEPLHPNCWGAVFKHSRFEWTGEFVQSKAVSRRGGMQRKWRLK